MRLSSLLVAVACVSLAHNAACEKTRGMFPVVPKTHKVMHISDLHFDVHYKTGSPSNCVFESTGYGCCRGSSIPNGKSHPAGPLGEYLCDSPPLLIEESLKWFSAHFKSNPEMKPDLILWTGDNASHEDFNQSPRRNSGASLAVAKMLREYMPDIPALPTLGNHEGWPVDQLSEFSFLNKWLLHPLGSDWETWIGDMPSVSPGDMEKGDAEFLSLSPKESMMKHGYYTVKIFEGIDHQKRSLRTHAQSLGDASPRGGLRAVVLNCLWHDDINLFIRFHDRKGTGKADPGKQYRFLETALAYARRHGEKVWLVSHIPPSESKQDHAYSYPANYVNIIEKYSDVIVGGFYGHSHNDYFVLSSSIKETPTRDTDSNPDAFLGVSYLAPSLTPSGKWPSVRIYDIDANAFHATDYVQYVGDMETANKNFVEGDTAFPKIEYRVHYRARKDFGLESLTPQGWYRWIQQLRARTLGDGKPESRNETEFQRVMGLLGGPNYGAKTNGACSGGCVEGWFCRALNPEGTQFQKCLAKLGGDDDGLFDNIVDRIVKGDGQKSKGDGVSGSIFDADEYMELPVSLWPENIEKSTHDEQVVDLLIHG